MACNNREHKLREELTCAICYDLFRNPVMLECMHHFCKECIQKYWNSCSKVASCPQCRREFPSRSLRPDFRLSNLVEAVQRCSSEEHRRKVQTNLQDILQSYQMEREKLLERKHVTDDNISHFVKTSSKLNSEIRAAFQRLHQILEEEERAVLMDLAKEKELGLVKLQEDSERLTEEIAEFKKNIDCVQQKLHNLDSLSLLEVESVPIRPAVQLRAFTFNLEHHKELDDGPLQYIFWRKMLKSINPAPVPLHLDPETAHPNLILSKDLTAVTEQEILHMVPNSPKRFLRCVNVLAKESFESGKHYWEVWVGSKTKWDLGVAAHNVDRTTRVRLCPENGYWAVRLRKNGQFWAAATPWVRLEPRHPLRKVGVLLDCEAKKVTFYNAEDMSLLFTFHRLRPCKFYPFFSTCFSDGQTNAEPMRICHPPRMP